MNKVKLKSLNNHTVLEVKSEISKKLKRNINNIKLFGSRICGEYKYDSDLDVFILDKRRNPEKMKPFEYINILGINAEIHYVDTFEDSISKFYSI